MLEDCPITAVEETVGNCKLEDTRPPPPTEMTEENVEGDCAMTLEIAPPVDEDARTVAALDEGATLEDRAEADVCPIVDERTLDDEGP